MSDLEQPLLLKVRRRGRHSLHRIVMPPKHRRADRGSAEVLEAG